VCSFFLISFEAERGAFGLEGFAVSDTFFVSPVCIEFALLFKHASLSIDCEGVASVRLDTAGHQPVSRLPAW
jgi:hypothetical protein